MLVFSLAFMKSYSHVFRFDFAIVLKWGSYYTWNGYLLLTLLEDAIQLVGVFACYERVYHFGSGITGFFINHLSRFMLLHLLCFCCFVPFFALFCCGYFKLTCFAIATSSWYRFYLEVFFLEGVLFVLQCLVELKYCFSPLIPPYILHHSLL